MRRSRSTGLHLLFRLPFLLALCLSFGCHLFDLNPNLNDRSEKTDKDGAPPLPGKRCSFRVSQYYFYADFDLKKDLPIFRELSDLRDQVHKELQLPSASTVVQVYLFEDRDRYERFMKARYPDLPKRRAFFIAQPRSVGTEDLLVFTYWGDRVQQDLRHELTHALLHSVLKDVPLWLDEGLAEYYEVPADWKGVNFQHAQSLCRTSFQPDLARLEQLGQVQQMSPAEYREAWAWTHWMLRGQPEARTVLLKYLQELRTNPKPGPLGPRLLAAVPRLHESLEQHVTQLNSGVSPPPTAQR